jgi:SAM-dependent methyltransferase
MPPTSTPPAARELRDRLLAAARRGAPGAGLREVAALSASAAVPPPDLAPFLWRARGPLATWLEAALAGGARDGDWERDPAGHLTVLVVRSLQPSNQFALDPATVALLDALHARALGTLRDALRAAPGDVAAGEAALSATTAKIAADYRAALVALARGALAPGGAALRQVASAEYEPELQLRLLGLDPAALVPPVLDLGCGAEARLVRHLRARGVDARGIDRAAEPGDGVRRGDWLAEPLAPGSLGTIVSHLGFSLHFLHQHLRPGGDAARYARRYMELLRALRPGGTFAYAPGLPFVEEHLPTATWDVARIRIDAPAPPGAAAALPWYAARVTRRAG